MESTVRGVQDCMICFVIWLHLSTGWPLYIRTAKLTKDWIATNCSEFIGLRTTMSGELCLNATSHFNPSWRTSTSSRKFCSWYGTSCHKTRSTKPYLATGKDFGLVWKLVVDTSIIR